MEIRELKARLDIIEVAAKLGITLDRHNKTCCPFHDDKTPSLQFSREKQIATCFSSNCTAGTMDVISLTEKYLKRSTHEAIQWLKQNYSLETVPPMIQAKTPAALDKIALLTKAFGFMQNAIANSEKAKTYLQSRNLEYNKSEIGYNTGQFHLRGNKHFTETAEKYGLLKSLGGGNYKAWAKDCIIFPLRNKEGKIVSLYGRSLTAGHFYMKDREGLYPHYPKADTKKIILTESIIDAETLLQLRSLPSETGKALRQYELLACYGTEGTAEQLEAVKELKELEEAIIFFDGDNPGREGAAKLAAALEQINTALKISIVSCPEEEDINSLAQSHQAEVFLHLLEKRKPFSSSSEETPEKEVTPSLYTLHTTNPELLVYETPQLLISILGGIKLSGLDRLKVTLKIESKEKRYVFPLRHSLDLYHNKQTGELVEKTSEQMEISHREAMLAIGQLTGSLESYRESRLEALRTPKKEKKELSPYEKQKAVEYLKSPHLLKRTLEDIQASGMIGEAKNSLIAFLVYTSRKREKPLHLMSLGASGSGKTYLQEKISELIPEDEKIEITMLSENAFYYFGQQELKGKLILIEDLDGAQEVLYPLRELQSKRQITKTVTLKDSKGNLKTMTLKVEGPVCVSGCTTRERLYEDNANRCLLIYIDQSESQDKRIMEYQRKASAGQIDQYGEEEARKRLQDVQSVLQYVRVVNPYAEYIELPDAIFKPRRSMTLLLSFIETVTFYHQYQRESKVDTQTKERYIVTTPADIEASFYLLKEVLFAKSDELSGACRSFFERLKSWLQQERKQSFKTQDIRKALRLNSSNLKRYLIELTKNGYVKVSAGNKYKGFEYQVADYEEYNELRGSIEQKLSEILEKIKEVSGSVVQ
jgi:DNA primase